jgi:hypothetical protein
VLESIDLNIQPSNEQSEETKVKVMIEYGEGDNMPKIEDLSIDTLAQIIGLANDQFPFALAEVSRAFQAAAHPRPRWTCTRRALRGRSA